MINEQNFSEIIDFLRNVSDEASKKILEIYNSTITYKLKSDSSPVTIADIESNKIICEKIKKKFKNIPIISEENKKSTLKSDTFFLVDPLDGTKEFISKNGEFTVNISLVIKNQPKLGVIQLPTKKTQYFSDGFNSYKYNGNLRKIFSREMVKKIRILASRSHLDKFTEKIFKMIDNAKLKKVGSSIKFCYLAEGKADIYIRNGKTMGWDVAAGIAILKTAGCDIKKLNLKKFQVNKKTFINNSFICFRDTFPYQRLKFISNQYNLTKNNV